MRKFTIEEVKKFVEENSNSKCLSNEYVNNREKLLFLCSCGIQFRTDFSKFKGRNKRQCNECSRREFGEKHRVPMEVFLKKLNRKFNNELELISDYKCISEKVLVKHKICGYQWEVSPNSLLRTQGCPLCNKNNPIINNRMYKERIFEMHGDEIKPLEKYVDAKTKIRFLCNKCNYSWSTSAHLVTDGHGCPNCYWRKMQKEQTLSIDQVKNKVEGIKNGEFILASDAYVNSKINIEILHKKCNRIFTTRLHNFLRYEKCPNCDKKVSRGEKKVEEILYKYGLKYCKQYILEGCKHINFLPFDFAIFNQNGDLKVLIEYDGEQHYKPIDFFGGEKAFKERIRNDEIKNRYCEENNIELIRIPYWEYNNIEEQIDIKTIQVILDDYKVA